MRGANILVHGQYYFLQININLNVRAVMVSGKVQWACTVVAFNSPLKSMYGFNIDSLALCVCQSCGSLRARVCKAAAYPPPHLYFLSNIKYMHHTIFGDVLCANDKQAARRWELLTSAAPFSRPRWRGGGGVVGSFASQQQMVIPATYATGFDTRTRGMHTWRRSFVRSLEREFKKRIFFLSRAANTARRRTPGRLAAIGIFAPQPFRCFLQICFLRALSALSHPRALTANGTRLVSSFVIDEKCSRSANECAAPPSQPILLTCNFYLMKIYFTFYRRQAWNTQIQLFESF